MNTHRYMDKNDPFNGEKYRTGEECAEKGCQNPAGTWWSPYWCVECNIKRMDKITNSLNRLLKICDPPRKVATHGD